MNDILNQANNARRSYAFDKAKPLYQKLLQEEPRNLFVLEGLVECLYNLGEFDKALEFCKIVLEYDQNRHLPHVYYAYIYDFHGNRDEAIKEAQVAFELNSNSPEALCCYGIFSLVRNNIDDAILYLNRAVQIDPNMYLAHYNLAVCYYKQGAFVQYYKEVKILYKLHSSLRNLIFLIGAYLTKNKLLGFSVIILPMLMYMANVKVFLGIHVLLVFAHLIIAGYSYKAKDIEAVKNNLLNVAVIAILDIMLIANDR